MGVYTPFRPRIKKTNFDLRQFINWGMWDDPLKLGCEKWNTFLETNSSK